MFNFFDELKKEFRLPFLMEYNLINMSGKALYVEGHLGIMTISKELISFRVKHGVVVVEGSALSIKELSSSTLFIEGKIKKTEIF